METKSTVIFADGTEIEAVAVYGGTMFHQSAQRSTLEIVLPADSLPLEEAKKVYKSSEKTSEITVTDGASSSVHLNFTVPVALTVTEQDGEDVVKIKLAQKSELEIAQERQAQDIEDNQTALMELAEMIAGGEEA